MATPFMIDDEARAKLHELRATAEANPLTRDDMIALATAFQMGQRTPPRLNREQTITLPFGFTVTLTIEWQPMGVCRHMSVASPREDRAPIDAAMRMVGEELGFTMESYNQYLEPMANGGVAVNVIEVIAPHAEERPN